MTQVDEIALFRSTAYRFVDLLDMGALMPKWSVYENPTGQFCAGVRFATAELSSVLPAVMQAVAKLMCDGGKELSLRVHAHGDQFEPKPHEEGIRMSGVTAVTLIWS